MSTPWASASGRRMRLFILQPEVVFEAQVNTASELSYPLDEVPFDTVTEGAYTDILPGMTVLFGSTPGNDDLGRQRIRSAAGAATLYIGRSSKGFFDGEVWAIDDAYITVLNDYRVWAKVPYIRINEDLTHTTFKDSDIAYSDQNEESSPVANCGTGYAGTAVGGVLAVAFDGSSSFATADGATIASYAWDHADGNLISGAGDAATNVAEFPPGFRWVSLTVQDSNGKTHVARCPVFVDDPTASTCIPYFQVDSHRIGADGQEISFVIRQQISEGNYPDGTLVMLWVGEPSSSSDRSHMMFVGWHQQDPTEITASATATLREVQLDCVDVMGRLKSLPSFGQEVENSSDPEDWEHLLNLNMDKYLHYLLHWHSTALELADWTWTGTGGDYAAVILGSVGDSLQNQVSKRSEAMVPPYKFTCDTWGALHTVPDPMLQDTGDRTSTVQASLGTDDWSEISYTTQRVPRTHWLRVGAILAHATELTTVWSIAPGDTPGQGGGESETDEHLAISQEDLNNLTGHRYARLNSILGKFRINLVGSELGDIQPALMQWVQVTLSSAVAAQRGLAFTNARGLVDNIRISYGHSRSGITRSISLEWEKETTGFEAATVDVEEAEPVDPEDSWVPPDTDWEPPLPGDPDVFYPPVKGYVLWDGAHILRTWDIMVSSPVWELVDTGISGNIRDLQYVHTGPTTVGVWLMTSTAIWWCADIMATSPTWDDVLTITTVRAAESTPTTGDSHFKCMAHYPSQPGHLCVATGPLAAGNTNTSYAHAYFWVTTDYGADWTQVDMPWTFEDIAGIRGYCYSGQYAMAAFHTPPGTLYCVRSAPTFGSGRNVHVFKSGNLGLSWQQPTDMNLTVKLPVPSASDAIDFSVLHPFPSATSPAYATGGALASDLHWLFLSEDNWTDTDNVTVVSQGDDPAGYDGLSRLWRPNKRTLDEDHVIAWMRETSSAEYHLMQSVDKGQNWTLLYDSSLAAGNVPGTGLATNVSACQYNTPNGWPADGDVWFLVRAVVTGGSITGVVSSTTDNFATSPVSRVGNLASVLPGGASGWTSGSAGGFALPKVGVNA